MSDQNTSPPRIRALRLTRSAMTPASGSAAAYTHMNAEPTTPSCSLLRSSSVLSSGKTEKIACRSA
jgi:hypothetical protein